MAESPPALITRKTVVVLPGGNAYLIPAGLRVFDFQPREEIRGNPGVNPPGLRLEEYPPHLKEVEELRKAWPIYLRADQVQNKADYGKPNIALTFYKVGVVLSIAGLCLAFWPLTKREASGLLLAFLGFHCMALFFATPLENNEIERERAKERAARGQ